MRLKARFDSLTPGKRAVIMILHADYLNIWPVHDPMLAITEQSRDDTDATTTSVLLFMGLPNFD
ncbi:hypothetical protein C8K44_11419 [Aminobacter sp. AP02]|nr:hypothetical protein C8K44_11419 [Aminobacter sp. AP02]